MYVRDRRHMAGLICETGDEVVSCASSSCSLRHISVVDALLNKSYLLYYIDSNLPSSLGSIAKDVASTPHLPSTCDVDSAVIWTYLHGWGGDE